MKTILVDAINGFVLEDGSILEPMHKLLESYPNPKLVLLEQMMNSSENSN